LRTLGILYFAAFTILGASVAQSEPIKIGVSGPFTGGSSSMGISMRNGVRLAVDEINAAGVLGRQIELVERDDEARNELGVQVAQELINKEDVVAAVGFVNTGVALAAQRFYQDAAIPVITNVATGSMVTHQFDGPSFIFRNSASDTIQTAMIAKEVVERRRIKKPAIFADSTNYGQLGKEDMLDALGRFGVKPVAVEKFNIGDTDMTAQVLRAKEAGAEAIITFGIGPELAQIANAMAKLGWKVPMIGSWSLSMSNFIDAAGANADGAIMPQTFIQSPTTDRRKKFIEAYQKKYSVERIPSPVSAAQGYDSIYLLAAAIKQAKGSDGDKIRLALENLSEKIEGVVTTYDHPFSATDHEAITAGIPVMGIVEKGRVVLAHPEDLSGANAARIKSGN